ncbi:MAG TPA: LamG-like jellyroll fold domain-containing protein, partial [Clostridia bacterium]|nr:LamG-like jellyroll fold domain-containing protein [Clostridia bacterium]
MAIAVAVCCFGAYSASSQTTYCVRAGASGNGSDWNNALPSLPASLVRGATYYIADGTYPAYTFDDAESGTTLITIKKATGANHGTSTGWQAAYGDGQAIFSGRLTFSRGYYVLDGQTRNESDWFAGDSYGFRINYSDLNQQIKIGTLGGSPAHGVQIKYVFVNAPYRNLPTNTIRQYAIDTESSVSTRGVLIHRCYVYGANNVFYLRHTTGAIVEYCAAQGAYNNDANHGEVVNLFYNTPGAIIRYNRFGPCYGPAYGGNGSAGTAVVALTGNDGGGSCEIYGNVFWGFHTGDAVIGFDGSYANNNKVYNNTFVDGWGGNGLKFGSGTGNVAYNNIWVNCGSIGFSAVTHDYNAFSGSSSYSESRAQTGLSTSIFVNYNGRDFRLASPTSAGSSLASPYNVDMLGVTRGADGTWDRGAYDYGTSTRDTTPPTISGVSSSVTTSSATITWQTSESSTSFVDYGTTTSYGSTASASGSVSSHTVVLNGLNANTTYNFRVRSADAAGNSSTSANFTFRTSAIVADTTRPTVTLTAPGNGVAASGTVTLSATASDNVGVAGVRFYVGGTQVVDDTTSPYSYAWDSATVANGSYAIYAQVRDSAGNTAWSGTNIISINNMVAELPKAGASWCFNEGAGSMALDGVSTNTVTLRNGMGWTSAGKFGSALLLDGIDDRAEAPHSSSLDIKGNALTVAAWVKLDSQANWQQIVAKVMEVGAFNSPYFSWHLFGGHASTTQWRPQFQVVTAGPSSVNVSSAVNVNYGEWAHIVGVYDGTAVRIYVNGVAQGSAAQTGNIVSYNSPIYIGA